MQEAFYHTNRVCTLSFHQYDPDNNFFPGTGGLEEIGEHHGQHCSINVPLKPGCTDSKFLFLFNKVLADTIETFRPDAIFMQCGADSLRGDTIGAFNMTIRGHSRAVKTVLGYNIPTVFSGGGGYCVENVARCWAYESLVITGKGLDHHVIPEDSQYKYEYQSRDLTFSPPNKHGIFEEWNTQDYVSKLLEKVCTSIRKIDSSLPFLDKIEHEGSYRWVDKRHVEQHEKLDPLEE